MHILINVAVLYKQVPSQPIRHGHVGLGNIIILNREALIEFVPLSFIKARVVVA
jgi:hypothetical protein